MKADGSQQRDQLLLDGELSKTAWRRWHVNHVVQNEDFHIEMMDVGKETKKAMTMSEKSDANSMRLQSETWGA